MSVRADGTPAAASGPQIRRRTIATYSSYREAERAVDSLSDAGFPVERVSIVGRDLRYVEQVTGRTGWLDSALRGLLTGALVGVLIGWLFAIFDWFDPLVARGWLILDGLWFGAVVGLLAGLLGYALTRGRRDFLAVGGLEAQRYDVVVDEEVADEALRVLGTLAQQPDEPRFHTPDRENRGTADAPRDKPGPETPAQR